MEATTIEEAVSLITEPTEAPKEAEAAEAVEVEDAEVIEEPIEAEAPTQEFESDDDDVDFELDDVEFDTTPEVEATEETNLIPVKVNGKEEMWTLDQLKQSAAGQGYINQRMQEIAQLEKQYTAQTQQLAQQREEQARREQQFLQFQQQAQEIGVAPPTPPSKEMFESDPIGYMEAKMNYEEEVGRYNQHVNQIRQMQMQQQAQEEAQEEAFKQEQARLLAERIPEIVDPEKGDKLKRDLLKVGVSYGFSEQEMAGVTDARYILALNDALKWRRLQQKKTAASKGGEQSTPVVKAGAKRRAGDGEAAARKKQQQKLRKSGRIEDALSLMIKP